MTVSAFVLTILLSVTLSFGLGAQDATEAATEEAGSWERAVDAIQHRRNDEAIPLLRLVRQERDEKWAEATRLLAHALEREGRVDEAKEVLQGGLDAPEATPEEQSVIAVDLAALLRREGNLEEADSVYTAALERDGGAAPAYLNRANIRVERRRYEEAVDDYELYLALRPRTEQRSEIEAMIALLTEEIEAERISREEEERRRAEEEAALERAEEEQRKREEEERRLAEERRRSMLDSVLESLGTAETQTESFELGNEEIQDFEEELDILD